MTVEISNPIFHDEDKAREHLEAIRWPNGPVCPFCGQQETVKALGGKSMGAGWYHCKDCRKKFTVRVGSVYERSKIPLHKWLFATHMMVSSKKGVSAHQLHRMLNITYKSAWFMAHRIREAMREEGLEPMGGDGGIVEIDETFLGTDPKWTRYHKGKHGPQQKMKVLALVDRKTGKARTMVVDMLTQRDLLPILRENIAREARVSTDEAGYHVNLGKSFAEHMSVNHSAGEYGRGDAHTNTLENYFSIFKRGMKGVYQHCDKQHLHRYVAEYQFRYNHRSSLGVEDAERAIAAIKGAEGKRLTYRRTDARASA
jgi:transposase-like protein